MTTSSDSVFTLFSFEKDKNIKMDKEQQYLSPYDTTLLKISLSDVMIDNNNFIIDNNNNNNNNNDEKDESKSKIKISTIHEKVFSKLGIQSTTTNNIKRKCLTEVKVNYPSSTIPCPKLSQVKKLISSQQLLLGIFSLDGYNFSEEFANVYKGESTENTIYKDLITICKRAIMAQENIDIEDEILTSYAEYILTIAAWELSIGLSVCTDSIKASIPNVNIIAGQKTNISIVSSVYIGMAKNNTLYFWVRTTPEFVFEEKNKSVGFRAKKVNVETACQRVIATGKFCYYRRFDLNVEAVSITQAYDTSIIRQRDDVPAPPPKPPSLKDIAVYLNFSQLKLAEQTSNDTEFILDEDVGVERHIYESDSERTEERSKRSRSTIKDREVADVTCCAELIGWGQNDSFSLGMPTDTVYEPTPVLFPPLLAMEKINMIACSPRHTLILSSFGNIYSCGENSEGALGLGDTISRMSLTLLTWPIDPLKPSDSPPRIVKVAAGTGPIGSHSMAIDANGLLYGWGVGYSIGLGQVKGSSTPKVITFPPDENDAIADDDNDKMAVRDVACGGTFTVVVLKSGKVYSFGMWSHGRLGLGQAPYLKTKKRQKKLARYQLRPSLLKGVDNAISVACGEAHCLCLLQNGSVLAWGQNSCGQLGTGPTRSGFLRDEFNPVEVNPFVEFTGVKSPRSSSSVNSIRTTSTAMPSSVTIKSVHCGSYHSIAIDVDGYAWSWGARGSPCIGHQDCELKGDWAKLANSVFPAGTLAVQIMIPYELKDWATTWSRPRRIETITDHEIVQVSAGDMHTGFLTSEGIALFCGIGVVVPPYVPVKAMDDEYEYEIDDDELDEDEDELDEDNDKDNDNENNDNNEDDKDKSLKSLTAEEKRRLKRLSKYIVTVSNPSRPGNAWLPTLSTRRSKIIAGSGTHCFLLQDEEMISHSLTYQLVRKALNGARGGSSLKGEPMDDHSIDSFMRSDDESIGSFFEQRGRTDCMLIASGKVLLCHRALLAQRSPELRDMIAMETPDDDDFDQPVQILVPELTSLSAKAFLIFLYTDVLPKWTMSDLPTLRALKQVAKTLRIPRLQILCERLEKIYNVTLRPTEEESDNIGFELPPPTLSRDLGALVGDTQFADVRFIAEGRALTAHRFILESRCEYFRAMFRSGQTGAHVNNLARLGGMIDVVVPDTFVGFLRLLIFLYTDTLPDGSDAALLEDMKSADRYDVPDMKSLCESMITPSKTNWMNLLEASDLFGSSRLYVEVMNFLRSDVSILMENQVMKIANERFPGLISEVLSLRKEIHPAPPSKIFSEYVRIMKKEKEIAQNTNHRIPIWILVVIAIMAYIYAKSASLVSTGYFVPTVNITFMIGGIIYLFATQTKFLNNKFKSF